MPFHDREHAARLLARRLSARRGQAPLVLTLHRRQAPTALAGGA